VPTSSRLFTRIEKPSALVEHMREARGHPVNSPKRRMRSVKLGVSTFIWDRQRRLLSLPNDEDERKKAPR
jgi:hypothetical protein